jgi:hypothetical protein
MPFAANRFAQSMRQRLLPNGVDWHIEEIETLFGHKFGSESAPFTFFKRPVPPYVSDIHEFFKRSVVSEIMQFLKHTRKAHLS